MNKKWLILFVGLIGVLILIVLALIAEYIPHITTPAAVPTPVPTLTPYVNSSTPNPTAEENTKKLLDNVEHRQTPSEQDSQVRQQLIANTTPANDVVYQTPDYIIHYVPDADDFETEILSADIEGTKQAVVNWFVAKGISNEGICSLPLNFYLNHNTADTLRSQGKSVEFNRIPNNC